MGEVAFLLAYAAILAGALFAYWRVEAWRTREHAKALREDLAHHAKHPAKPQSEPEN